MRAPVDTIVAPLFPTKLPWVNAQGGAAGKDGGHASILRRGKPMLVEFWDFCRPNSIRTLPYVKAWHERYGADGLRVIGVHCPGFEVSRDEQAVRDAVARLGIEHPVLIDSELEVWREYENMGWPARYLFDGRARLSHYHYGEGAYEETELAIGELLGIQREPLAPLRPEDAESALLAPQSEDREGAWSGPYEAGGIWAVLAGRGSVTATSTMGGDGESGDGESSDWESMVKTLSIEHPGAYPLFEHERHTEGVLDLRIGEGVECLATCFTPGVV